MQAGSCRLKVGECDRMWCLGDSGGSSAVRHRPGVQWCNGNHLSSSWTAAVGSLRWTPVSWSWGGAWAGEVEEGGSGVKAAALV